MGTLTPKPKCVKKRRRFDMLQPNYDRYYLIPLSGTSSSNSSSSSGLPLLFLLANLSRANCSCRSRSRRNLRDNPKTISCRGNGDTFRESKVGIQFKSAIYRELKQPRRRRQRKPHKFVYLTLKNSIFARFARTFFIF